MGWALSIDPESCMRLTMTLAHFLWLGTAIGLLAGLLMLGLRHSSAQLRYCVLVLTLCVMAICPVVTSPNFGMHISSMSLTSGFFRLIDPPTLMYSQ